MMAGFGVTSFRRRFTSTNGTISDGVIATRWVYIPGASSGTRTERISVRYTPGILRNGHEWRGGRNAAATRTPGEQVGVLRVFIGNETRSSHYAPVKLSANDLVLNVATMVFNL